MKRYIDPVDANALNAIQGASGLNRRDFGVCMGYRYSTMKEFYGGRYPIPDKLKPTLILWQFASKKLKEHILCEMYPLVYPAVDEGVK